MNSAHNIVQQKKKPSPRINQKALQLFVRRVQRLIGLRKDIAILVTDNTCMRMLNRRFRKKNKITDVLSFPSAVPGCAGDIAISSQIAAANAIKLGHSFHTELEILVLHGLLHLAGYDHRTDGGKMARKEMLLRKKLGLPVSLTER